MIFDRLTLQNFGLYAGRQVVLLTPPDPRQPIVLFGGLNGAGKTTLLDAIQLSLYGKLAPCFSRQSGYSDYLDRSMHRNMGATDVTSIELEFRHREDGQELRYSVLRSWSRTGKSVKEQLDVRVNGHPRTDLVEQWQSHVEDLLPVRLASLFFFDGEKIESLADTTSSAELLRTAVHSLLGLDIVDQLSTDLAVLEQRRRVAELKEDDRLELERLEHKLVTLGEQRETLLQDIAQAFTEREQAEKFKVRADEEFRKQGGELYLKRRELEERRSQQEQSIHRQEERLRELAMDVAPLLMLRPLLQETHKQALTEQRAEEARVLDRALSDRDQSLMTLLQELQLAHDEVRKIEKHLSTDRAERRQLSLQKSYLRLEPETFKQLDLLMDSSFLDVQPLIQQELGVLDALKQQKLESERLLQGIPGQEQIQGLLEERSQWEQKLLALKHRETVLAEERKKLEWEREKEQNRHRAMLVRHTELELERRRLEGQIEHIQRARQSLVRFRGNVLARQLQRIEREILSCFQELLHKDQLVAGLLIVPETFRIRLLDPTGQEVEAQRLSAGERQLLAVSILWGLARASGKILPVVIDTPMGRLDSLHRTNLLERYFPHASHQVILLSTDEEIDQLAYNLLRPSIGHLYRLNYQDSQRATQVQAGYFPKVQL